MKLDKLFIIHRRNVKNVPNPRRPKFILPSPFPSKHPVLTTQGKSLDNADFTYIHAYTHIYTHCASYLRKHSHDTGCCQYDSKRGAKQKRFKREKEEERGCLGGWIDGENKNGLGPWKLGQPGDVGMFYNGWTERFLRPFVFPSPFSSSSPFYFPFFFLFFFWTGTTPDPGMAAIVTATTKVQLKRKGPTISRISFHDFFPLPIKRASQLSTREKNGVLLGYNPAYDIRRCIERSEKEGDNKEV